MSGAYLDHAAATPLDPRVREAMLPFLGGEFGSPSSLHDAGRRPAATSR
jgi:cysteine desulfurase